MVENIQSIKVLSHFLTAINFGVIALALMVLLKRSDIGHRTLIRLIIVFNIMVSGDSVFGAWNQFHRHSNAFAMMRFGTAVFGTCCVIYFLVSNADVVRTLRISELWDRLRKDKVTDSEQARMQMTYASEQTLQRSQDLVIAACSKTH
jgi:hypothetical protein